MKYALQHLFTDFLAALLFLAVYLATGNVAAGAAVAIVAGLAQAAFQLATGRRINPMQWLSLAIILVLSAASIATDSPRFVMLKPSLAHFAIGAAMLKRGWLNRYLPEIAQKNLPETVPVAAGYAWAGLMLTLGLTNVAVALCADFATWAWFVSVGLVSAKVGAFALQYVVFRTLIRRRLAGAPVAAARPSAATMAAVAAAVILAAGADNAGAVGFQQLTMPDGDGVPFQVALWYPSDAAAAPLQLGPYEQTVAVNGPVAGSQLPLVVISHGTGGALLSHYDTAIALAGAGFIAAAVEHTGDNWRDRSYSFTARNFIERPRHLHMLLDYLLSVWDDRERIDPERIGAFGHSAGGYTVLTAIGGEPDPSEANAFCRDHPEDWGCRRAAARAAPPAPALSPVWTHDPRIKAALIAAPAAGHVFSPASLAPVAVPVQLWEGEQDKIAVSRWSGDVIAAGLPTPPDLHVVSGAGHFAFLAPCSAALAQMFPGVCEDPAGFDRAAFHRAFNPAVAEFFMKALNPS